MYAIFFMRVGALRNWVVFWSVAFLLGIIPLDWGEKRKVGSFTQKKKKRKKRKNWVAQKVHDLLKKKNITLLIISYSKNVLYDSLQAQFIFNTTHSRYGNYKNDVTHVFN